ncbi:flagellar export protein FliJ [Desulfothermus sp.]
MAKFQFRLQRILDYREQIEEQAKMRLAKILSLISQKKEQINQYEQELEQISKVISMGNLSEHSLWLYKESEKNILLSIDQLKKELKDLSQKAEILRQDLILKTIERKKLEKLKQKDHERFIYEEQKREQKEIDEISTLRYEKSLN